MLILLLWPEFLDVALAINNAIYATALIRLGLRGSDAVSWVEMRRLDKMILFLWLVVGVLIVSGFTDAVIVYDFVLNSGANTGSIVGWATIFGGLVTVLCIAIVRLVISSGRAPLDAEDEDSVNVLAALKQIILAEKLHLDPDINLNRIAKRLVLPAREISRAINTQTGNNFSQFIDRLRIEEACRLLRDTDMPITQIIFASGFNTKSNFNREFSRILNKSPSEWRAELTN